MHVHPESDLQDNYRRVIKSGPDEDPHFLAEGKLIPLLLTRFIGVTHFMTNNIFQLVYLFLITNMQK